MREIFCLNSFLLNLKLHENSDKECDNDNVSKSKSLRVAYTTLMIEISPASSDNILREMAESSLKIDPHNANPFIVLTDSVLKLYLIQKIHLMNRWQWQWEHAFLKSIQQVHTHRIYFLLLSFYCIKHEHRTKILSTLSGCNKSYDKSDEQQAEWCKSIRSLSSIVIKPL